MNVATSAGFKKFVSQIRRWDRSVRNGSNLIRRLVPSISRGGLISVSISWICLLCLHGTGVSARVHSRQNCC